MSPNVPPVKRGVPNCPVVLFAMPIPTPRDEIARAIVDEEWRPVVGWEGVYEVSDAGRVRRIKESGKGRPPVPYIIKPEINNGYLKVTLKYNGRKGKMWVHRAVAFAFLGKPPPGHEVAHGDGIGVNCHLSNLRWATKSENSLDRRKHGTVPWGTRHHWSTLSDEMVLRINDEIRAGLSNVEIGIKLGIPRQTSNAIRRRASLRYQRIEHADAA